MNTFEKGNLSLTKIISRFTEIEYRVSLPVGDASPYDLIVEVEDRLLKIQVKTGRYRDGNILFNVWSKTTCNGEISRNYYHGKIDAFSIYCIENNKCYFIPFEEVSHLKNCCKLRVELPKNNQSKKITWAKGYEL